ncbi:MULTISPECIES: NADPH-dependent FMN reductase [unclassified Janthinobacterium]|uniref:NADPH-dependent FMN reductase n=1 Tax=unclassified Janthinobacterium TaxID=2610881 RepID=UPI0003482E68|nr:MULTISPECIES: NADPH-dependent FMN reductase [unclassified Janthinobacterium]MEC5159518.1 chromate reductase [Janthinobacterium sp. CG_S6]
MKILALSGSLRAASLNSALLRALARIAPADIHVQLFAGVGALPLFNPDLEASDPAPVAALRQAILAADAVVIASPEYAHGVSGVMKNALDWMVSNESFINKPLALFNASPRATLAHAALRETLLTMSARVVDAASITLPLIGAGIGEDGIAEHPEMRAALLAALRRLQADATSQP